MHARTTGVSHEMEKVLLRSRDVWAALGEGRTLFYSRVGSFHHPDFPPPLRRPGRAPQWLRADIERFAAHIADQYRAQTPEVRPSAPSSPAREPRGRGRPRKPRPFAQEHTDEHRP